MMDEFRQLFLLTLLAKPSWEVQIETPTENVEMHQASCLTKLVESNFVPKGPYELLSIISPVELPEEADAIRNRIMKNLNFNEKLPIEITDGRRTNFVSAKIWKKDKKPPRYR